MSISVIGLAGFDQCLYDQLKTSYTRSTGKTDSDFDSLLLKTSRDGNLSFRNSVDEIRTYLPAPPGTVSYTCLGALPSFGSNYLALITELSSEERRQNAQMRAMQTEEMVAKIKEQADIIRDKAVTQLVTGIVTGTLSIAQGVTSFSMTAKGISAGKQAAETAQQRSMAQATNHGTTPLTGQNALNALESADNAATIARQMSDMMNNAKVQSFNSIMGGSSNIFSNIGQCVSTMFDAELKKSEADLELIRGLQNDLESLDESLKALIQKAITSQDTIQQNINQTRTRILG